MRWDVTATAGAEATSGLTTVLVLSHGITDGGGAIVGGGHGVLERTPGGEMLALADTALDLLVAQLLLQALFLGLAATHLGLLGLHILPVSARPEDDILADGSRVWLRSLGFALLEPEFRPVSPLRHHGVHFFFVHCRPGFACGFHFAALVVDPVGDRRLGSIFVDCRDGRWERGGVELFGV